MKKTISSLWSPYDDKTTQTRPIMLRLMIPLCILIALCALGTGVLAYQQHQHFLFDASNRKINELSHDMETLLEAQSSGMLLTITSMARDPRVIDALRERNSQKLLMQWQEIFEIMKEQNHLTHFYFMDKNRVCLLRVHKPGKKGDVIDRFTTMQAKWSRKSASGLEIGPLGTLTLRVVVPIMVKNELIGYIELGKEIEDVLQNLHSQPNLHLIMVLHKTYLKQMQWEEGMAILDRESDWNLLKNNVMIYSSFKNISHEIMELCDFKAGSTYKSDDTKEVSSQGSTYRVSVSAIKDVSRKEVGNLIIVNDITKENYEFFDAMTIGGLIAFGIIAVIVGLIYLLLRRTDEWIKDQQHHLLESNTLLNTIIDTIPIRVFWKNRSLNYLGCNAIFANDAGYKRSEELIGKDDYQMVWSAQADLYREDDREVMTTGEAKLFYEEPQMTPDGKMIWVHTSKVPLKNKYGEIFGVLGTYEEVTDKKEMENQLCMNAKRLNEAQHFARMGSWELDLINNTLVWSDEVFAIFEINPIEFRATYEGFLNGIHPEDREMVNYVYQNSLVTKQGYEITHRLLMNDGRIKWVHEIGMSEFDKEGNAIRSIGTVQDITERKNTEDQINQLAFFDPLTGLANRTLLIDRLHQAMVAGDQNSPFWALMFIDLDNFKSLNDTLGHGVGDNLLKQSAQRLMECIRDGDSAARLGGDEFVVLLSNLGSDESHAAVLSRLVAEKILAVFNQRYQLDSITYRATVSIGITLFRGDAVSVDELMKQADLAMYKSKEAGRNTLSFFDPKMETSLRERTLLEEEIRFGIQEEQFELYYQPQVNSDGRVYGVEALVRWNHPARGVVSPAEFIPIAEETGLILPLGTWILKRACSQIAQWSMQETFENLTIAVNVSARQFSQSDFVETVLIDYHGCPGAHRP